MAKNKKEITDKKKFVVHINEMFAKNLCVEAPNEEEARKIIQDAYENSGLELEVSDWVDTNYDVWEATEAEIEEYEEYIVKE